MVQFPNDECTSSSSSSTLGTCYTSSECGSRSGSASGSCAAGFGVCCVTSTSTCGATLSANISYIRNPGYPSSYTSAASGSCSVTISKASDNICQLRKGRIGNNLNYLNISNFPLTTLSYFDLSSRLDFQTMTGYTATVNGVCTDKFDATGQTGQDPPTICGTNTGYHSKIIVLLCLNTFIFFQFLKCMWSLEQPRLIP